MPEVVVDRDVAPAVGDRIGGVDGDQGSRAASRLPAVWAISMPSMSARKIQGCAKMPPAKPTPAPISRSSPPVEAGLKTPQP